MEKIDPKNEARELSDDELEGVDGGCGNTVPTNMNGVGGNSLANGVNANNYVPGAYNTGT